MAEFSPLGSIPLSTEWRVSPAIPSGVRFLRLIGQATGDSYAVAFFSFPTGGIIAPRRGLDLEDPLILPVPEIPGELRVGVRQRRRYKRVPIRTRTLSIRVDVLLEEEAESP